MGQNTDIHVEHLRERFVEIFKPEVGTVQGVTTKLLLKESASPAFKRARPAHYVLPSAVEEELKRLEHEGVLNPEEVSDWATPTVRVPKSDGPVRIYGDYKGTMNPTIQTEQFLVSTMEEWEAEYHLSWKSLRKSDVRSAYQQLVLDQKSQGLCAHRGSIPVQSIAIWNFFQSC